MAAGFLGNTDNTGKIKDFMLKKRYRDHYRSNTG